MNLLISYGTPLSFHWQKQKDAAKPMIKDKHIISYKSLNVHNVYINKILFLWMQFSFLNKQTKKEKKNSKTGNKIIYFDDPIIIFRFGNEVPCTTPF